MIATIKVEKKVILKWLEVKAKVRYWEDSEVNGISDDEGNLMPCRKNELWNPIIDIDTGVIINWEKGKKASIHYKVCDCCGWDIRDGYGESILSAKDGYVPATLCPKELGYGDYIIMDIDENGQIAKWKFDLDDFFGDED